jgi:CHAD domain-containing protein
MLEAFDSRRYAAFVAQFGRLVRARAPSRSGPAVLPARSVAPELVERRFRQVRKVASQIRPDSDPADYHRLRIRCKRFRYALEFFADLYPHHTRPVVRRLAALQDILGLHQDAEVAMDRLRRLAAERGSELEPATIFAMGEVAERYRNSMAELRALYPAAYARATGKAWKSFRRLLEEHRPSPGIVSGSAIGVAPDEAAP